MSTQHTPTPWRLCKVGPFIETVANGRGMNIIASCEDIDGDRPRAEDLANAAFIVRAVNSHTALLDALAGLVEQHRKALADLRQHYPQGWQWGEVPCLVAEKALKLAKEVK